MRSVPSQGNQTVQLHLLVIILHSGYFIYVVLFNNTHIAVGLTRRSQDGASQGQNTAELTALHLSIVPLDQTSVTIRDSDKFCVKELIAGPGNSADRGIQSRTISATG